MGAKISSSFLFLLMLFAFAAIGQKRSLTVDDMETWNHLRNQSISNDGKFVSYEVNPYKGDGVLYFWSSRNNETVKFNRGYSAVFSPGSNYLAFLIKPHHDSVRQMKLDKVKKEELPKDTLGIYLIDERVTSKKAAIKSFKMPEKDSEWMAWLFEKSPEDEKKPDSVKTDTAKQPKKSNKKADKSAPETNDMVVMNPVKVKEYKFKDVSEYAFSENGKALSFIQIQNDTILKSAVCVFYTETEKVDTLFCKNGLCKKVVADNSGNQFAFIHSADSVKKKTYSLLFWNNDGLKTIVDTLTESVPEKWTVSEHCKMYFSDNNRRLFFGIAPKPENEKKDTLLDEEKVHLDLWSWTDSKIQPEQLSELDDELKRNYLTSYSINRNKIVQLEDKTVRKVKLVLKGDGKYALGLDYQPYMKQGSWEEPYYRDVYSVDVETGSKKLVVHGIQSKVGISNSGKYIYWYENADSCWYSYSIETTETINLTNGLNVPFYKVNHDYPNEPGVYGVAGWTKNDEWFLAYDEFDIWKIDPAGQNKPVNLTQGYGRENSIEFRYIELDREAKYIDPGKDLFTRAFNKLSKAYGYYTTSINNRTEPEKIIDDNCYFYHPIKAQNSRKVIWRKSSFTRYPDVWYNDMDFKSPIKISDANPQQKDFYWGSVELVKWITSEGTVEEGLLYKPENFDPKKKYPMLVYFYRLYSDELHKHMTPKPSRSIINPTFYVSNDYIVFIPNIRYKVGYPGESAANYIISGVGALLNKYDYINKDKIGIQGQSWGGYEVAYTITKTDMFAAASAGAPVSNMTSAYGGVRWTSGMSRMFQYEESQSRIGGTLWEKPLHYIENSPVFYAPKVNTPLLIRHNDGDGAVPWYQGIELFLALRRLDKPVWLLNYNGAPHNEKNKSPNSRDLTIRMKQFFDHYLKDEPLPMWMKYGIPAIMKGKTMRYGYDKD